MNLGGPLSVAVGGGKGGVGKSVIASNLAAAMADLGFRVVLIDADLGSANLHTLLGIDRPGLTLQAMLDRKVESLEEAMVPTVIPRLFIVPGIGAVAGAANLAHAQKTKLIRSIQKLDADALVIDCGAGTSHNSVDFFNMADVRLVIASPQLTSLQNAYGFLKAAVYRDLRAEAANHREREALALATDRTETERISEILTRIAAEDPNLATRLTNCVETFGASAIGNQLEHSGQENVIHALARMVEDFLNVRLKVLPCIPRSDRIHRSVTIRRAFVESAPRSRESQLLRDIAEQLLSTDIHKLRAQRRRFEDDPSPTDLAGDEESLPGPIGRYLRRFQRYPVNWRGSIEIRGKWSVAEISDVSKGGLLLRTAHRLLPDQHVSVHIADPVHLTLRGTVRHVREQLAGIELESEDAQRYGDHLVEAVHRGAECRSA
ncbi:MAG: P-loop NTPase [Myxococcota bacterium]